ncbi:hypothetical protein A4A49_21106 [Nicotiana attenuata]|uniref:Uncharacterized protein n=1 Tax=Nicotiana attenuata TaxID=49451 RepID=A0A1J6I9W3_NICAT|nr:hypothetical protein A4A49_21106 [Nicotiana attenuata]
MPKMKKYVSSNYKSWWERLHGNFFEKHLQSLLNTVRPVTATPLEIMPQEHKREDNPPTLKSKVVVPCYVKGPPYKEVQKKKGLVQAHQVNKGSFPLGTVVPTSRKRPYQNESYSSHGDRNFKWVKPYSNKQGDANLGAVEITDKIGSTSRTLTAIKEARSTLSNKVVDVEKLVSFLNAKEHLDLVLIEKGEKVEKLSATSQSLKEVKEKMKQLRVLRGVAKKEVEEIESRVSSAEEKYRRCSDVFLKTADDLADVEMKKHHLEETLKDWVNHSLCLD